MNRHRLSSILIIFPLLVFGLALILSACASGGAGDQPPPTQLIIEVATIQEEATPSPLPSSTPWPSATAYVQPTLKPSSTPFPSWTPVTPSGQEAPTITLDPALAGCDLLRMVKDVTIPKGYYISPGTQFTKTWRLQNAGTCTWLAGDYQLVFDSGEQLSGPDTVRLTKNVLPGDTIDVSVQLKAPDNQGIYRGYWKLSNANGWRFGEDDGQTPFFVDILVGNVSNMRYDFIGFFCQAEWRADSVQVPCIGRYGDSHGFVLVQETPRLVDGTTSTEWALLTNPPAAHDGEIYGIFTEFTVHTGDRFQAKLDCEYAEASTCDVTFYLNYQIDDGPIQNYAHWEVGYDDPVKEVDTDLRDLVRSTVRFVLSVRSNGPTGGNRAQWLRPRIVYVQPTATPAPTLTSTP